MCDAPPPSTNPTNRQPPNHRMEQRRQRAVLVRTRTQARPIAVIEKISIHKQIIQRRSKAGGSPAAAAAAAALSPATAAVYATTYKQTSARAQRAYGALQSMWEGAASERVGERMTGQSVRHLDDEIARECWRIGHWWSRIRSPTTRINNNNTCTGTVSLNSAAAAIGCCWCSSATAAAAAATTTNTANATATTTTITTANTATTATATTIASL